MGIQFLNSYIKKNTSEKSLEIINFNKLSRKIIAVDINIYLHKFLAEGELFENLYLMFSLMKYYKIMPIFVFDGKPPPEKYELINKRYQERLIAENEYKKLCKTKHLENSEQEIINLKRKFLKPTKNEIKISQKLMNAFGFMYIEADGEADIVCAKLVIKKYAYACLSEDMDMFIYGCSIVLRLYSNTNIIYEYNLENILKAMNIDLKNFKYLSILANNKQKNKNIFYFYNIYSNFTNNNIPGEFIDYIKNLYIINDQQYDNLINIYNNYNLKNSDVLSKCNYILIKNRNSSNKLSGGRSRSIVCRCSFS